MADEILQCLSPMLEAMDADGGRPSSPPERLPKATISMALYKVRSERQFCEQLNYNLLFRWLLGMHDQATLGAQLVHAQPQRQVAFFGEADAISGSVQNLAKTQLFSSSERARG